MVSSQRTFKVRNASEIPVTFSWKVHRQPSKRRNGDTPVGFRKGCSSWNRLIWKRLCRNDRRPTTKGRMAICQGMKVTCLSWCSRGSVCTRHEI